MFAFIAAVAAAAAAVVCPMQVAGGWVLDGQKRWIGNGTWADVSIVWARSSVDGQVWRNN